MANNDKDTLVKEYRKPFSLFAGHILVKMFMVLMVIGFVVLYYITEIGNYREDLKKVRSVRAKIVDKRYVPVHAAYRTTVEEQFLLVYTNTQGHSFTINNSWLFGKAEKGDSVVVFYNFEKGNPHFLNIRKL